MRRHLRHTFTSVSILLILVVGTWLAIPRDMCLTKAFMQGCICLIEAGSGNGCVCCTEGSLGQRLACCSSHSTGEGSPEPEQHAPGCFSISSDGSSMTAPDRAPVAAPVFDVVALLPLPVSIPSTTGWEAPVYNSGQSLPDRMLSYRDNCAFLI